MRSHLASNSIYSLSYCYFSDTMSSQDSAASIESAVVGATIVANSDKQPPTQESFIDKPHPETVANKTILIHPSKFNWNAEVWRYYHIHETNPAGSKHADNGSVRYACCNKCGSNLVCSTTTPAVSLQPMQVWQSS